ncbi:MAG: potassium-transporting ATPase subunit KdpA [Planctomycetes bacterium]|nr:potassium-transporting ATPase subunit KdpA [Planctomycetota bacterium]
MLIDPDRVRRFSVQDSQFPKEAALMRRVELVAQFLGVGATILIHGLFRVTKVLNVELGLVVMLAMFVLTLGLGLRYRWSLLRSSFLRTHRVFFALQAAWLAGLLAVLLLKGVFPEWNGRPLTRFEVFLAWSEFLIVLRGVSGTVIVTRRATAGNTNPAMILVASFAILVIVGTLLLMLPRALADPDHELHSPAKRWQIALFTATSASCVTGLTVEPTGEYWSPLGQTIILVLFQIGGLGIMTCGAFFAVAAGKGMQIRESATLRDLMESEQLGDVRRLVLTILVFTLCAELLGAILLSGLWADKPFGECVRFSLFHSVSAFCNAGFSLTPDGFVGMGHRWQIWGVVAGLIVIGGTGFAVLYNIALAARARFSTIQFQPLFNLPKDRVRLSLSTKLAGGTTLLLLIGGSVGYYLLESTGRRDDTPAVAGESASPGKTTPTAAEAWFQSVTFRTAGFNTVDHGQLQPATKLFAILLMFIGASPGSTGGGVKTVCFAITMLALLSILRGRRRVEILGRTIPEDLVNRSLTIISLGGIVVMTATMLLVIFENEPALFLDHLFEATSAFATVGVSTGITPALQDPSKLVLAVTMFLGRVGPLTLLLALAGRTKDAHYEYPFERVTLG